MARQRKTIDTWQILVDYGSGWEHECTEFSMISAKQRRRDYVENCPQYPVKIKLKREQRSLHTKEDLEQIEAEAARALILHTRRRRFNTYVYSFYGPNSDLYPMGATRAQIEEATRKLLARKGEANVAFDSFDREAVRDILINEFGLKRPQPA